MTGGRRRATVATARGWMMAVGAVLAMLVSGACGYALAGRSNTLPAHVKVIGVPQFENRSSTAEIDVFISEAVLREFGSRGSLRAQPDEDNADAVLRGIITNVQSVASGLTADRQATRYFIVVTADVQFLDMRNNGEVIWADPSLVYREEYDAPPGAIAGDPLAIFRQDQDALERLAEKFAQSVVTAILTGD